MQKNWAWYLGGVLILGLTLLAVACASPVFPQPEPERPVAKIAPPLIPHELAGRADCRLCHETGIGGAPQFPVATHSQRPSDVCLACHMTEAIKKGGEAVTTTPTSATIDAAKLFATNCAVCHGEKRQGVAGLGPALTPTSLTKLSDAEVKSTILKGRPNTAMAGFEGQLSSEEIDVLLQLIKYTAP